MPSSVTRTERTPRVAVAGLHVDPRRSSLFAADRLCSAGDVASGGEAYLPSPTDRACDAVSLGPIHVREVMTGDYPVVGIAERAVQDDVYAVVVALEGTAIVAQEDREALVRPGLFAIGDRIRSFRCRGSARAHLVVIDLPRASVLAREPRIGQLMAVPLGGVGGIGALVSATLQSLTDLRSLASSPVAAQFGANLVELVAMAVTDCLGTMARVPERARYLAEARGYIVDHLDDPSLDPAATAAAVGISIRYLHALFHERGRSVERWIIERRLERAEAMLVDVAHHNRTVTDIAFAVGFKDAAHFSRVFKARSGIAPSAFRRMHGT